MLSFVTPTATRRVSVDIDSLLVGSSLTAECLAEALRHPRVAMLLPFWAMRGKTFLWRRLAGEAGGDAARPPYRPAAVEELLRSAKAGARVVLVTDADPAVARRVAEYLGI